MGARALWASPLGMTGPASGADGNAHAGGYSSTERSLPAGAGLYTHPHGQKPHDGGAQDRVVP